MCRRSRVQIHAGTLVVTYGGYTCLPTVYLAAWKELHHLPHNVMAQNGTSLTKCCCTIGKSIAPKFVQLFVHPVKQKKLMRFLWKNPLAHRSPGNEIIMINGDQRRKMIRKTHHNYFLCFPRGRYTFTLGHGSCILRGVRLA